MLPAARPPHFNGYSISPKIQLRMGLDNHLATEV